MLLAFELFLYDAQAKEKASSKLSYHFYYTWWKKVVELKPLNSFPVKMEKYPR